ncbi:hypothetical protein [uncultured Pseudacidovorax sp.]|uniref:hypothetical protein n=1 Tax=uncultured Pseudacidovorax sp. TaxID=679313 RepID=UPI000734FB7D|nr:hypothetical protein [uncultured Pseudacidovorax sp.]
MALILAAVAAAGSAWAGASTEAKKEKRTWTAAPAKANGSGIAVSYSVEPHPVTGRSTRIMLRFVEVGPAGGSVRVVAEPGLSLLTVPAQRALPSGESMWAVDVQPLADGLAYIDVFTTQGNATSAVSIPVQTGTGAQKLPVSPHLKTGPQGETLLIKPVP